MMEVICLEDNAFFSLLDRAIAHLKDTLAIKEDEWISPEEVMLKLRIKSKTTLQKLCDEGHIRFSHPERRIVLYYSESTGAYLSACERYFSIEAIRQSAVSLTSQKH